MDGGMPPVERASPAGLHNSPPMIMIDSQPAHPRAALPEMRARARPHTRAEVLTALVLFSGAVKRLECYNNTLKPSTR